jgi:pyruvate dehydrogenase E2 component (dihydrolipoamide acetyltransferase)
MTGTAPAPTTSVLYASDSRAGRCTIVFLHGFGGFHGVWDGIAEHFSGEARTIAYDLPGHGGSLTFPDAGPAKIAAHAILGDLTTRGVDKAHLVGHSMGGAVAALTALADPDRIASLTLLAPGGFGEEINGPLLRRFATATSQDEIRQCHAAMSAQDARLSPDAIGALCAMRSHPGQVEMLVRIAAAITRDDRQGVISRDKLATLSMPVSVVWGTKDPVLPFSQAQNLPHGFVLHEVANAGHMLVEEAPDLVTQIIERAIH